MSNQVCSAIVVNGDYPGPILTAVKVRNSLCVAVRTNKIICVQGERFQIKVKNVLVDESMNKSTTVVRLVFTLESLSDVVSALAWNQATLIERDGRNCHGDPMSHSVWAFFHVRLHASQPERVILVRNGFVLQE